MRVLVTGGAGFVGSHIVDHLLDSGAHVTIADDLSTGRAANVNPASTFVQIDIADRDAVLTELAGVAFDAIVHAAAKTKVTESLRNPAQYRHVIVGGTANVLELAKISGAHTFVNLSTGGVMYGETPECADETLEPQPASPYPALKLEAEGLVAATDMRCVSLRPANIYGPRQRDDLEGGVISIFIARWRTGIEVFGDGGARRDYVYVDDVVRSVGIALSGRQEGVYNLGTGVASSVTELIKHLTSLLGPPRTVTYAPAREGEPRRTCLNARKAEGAGLWNGGVALEAGLRLTLPAHLGG